MKKLALTTILTLYTLVVFGQTTFEQSDSKFRFGFSLGANYSLLQSKETLPNTAKIYNNFGAKFGVFMEYSITKDFLISPRIEVEFNKSGVDIENSDNTISSYKVYPVSGSIITHFIYKISDGKAIPYVLAGPNIRLPFVNNSISSNEFNNKPNLAVDFGVGLENRFKDFIFTPEIRYSWSLLRVNTNSISQTLKYHNVSFVLNFK